MNAFEVLKQASRKLSLPQPYPEDTKIAISKRTLYNRVLLVLQRAGLSFTADSMESGAMSRHPKIKYLYCLC